MALLEILHYPDPRLRVKAEVIAEIDEKIRSFVADMYETMYAARGVGLAATQVGVHQRIFVMDVSEAGHQGICAINPEIVSQSGTQMVSEGCLSVPGIFEKLERPQKVHLRALDIDGNQFELEAEGLMAECIRHEVDHLNGMLFIQHLSRLKQERIRSKIEKLKRRTL